MEKTEDILQELHAYAKAYRDPPTGCEVEGTPELLEKTAEYIEEARFCIEAMKKRYQIGVPVHRQGYDESDSIECPHCGFEVARNDDFVEMRPKHCPECGTKLIY